MRKRISNNKLLLAFLLSFVLGLLLVLPNIILGKGIYHLMSDFDQQQIPFNMIMNYSLKNKIFLWTWYNDLGSNFIGTFSFYNLLSPFSIIGYLFPGNIYPYIVGYIIILKYALSGLFSFMYLDRYVKNKNYAIIGSLLYSFSSFVLTNMLFHFHDAIVFFPLLMYSLDNLIYDFKKSRFIFIVFLCAITNWFLFVGEGIFIVIYCFIKYIKKEINNNKVILYIFLELFLGVLMSSFILVPTLLFTISNPRLSGDWTIISALKYPYMKYVELVRSLLFAPQTMIFRSFLSKDNYDSIEFYLPVVGIVLFSSYYFHNKKDDISLIMIISLLFMFIPIFNSLFFLLNTKYYARWLFMPILIFSLASIKTLDNDYSLKEGIIVTIIGYLFYFLLMIILYFKNLFKIYDIAYFIVFISFTIINFIIMVFLYKFKRKDIVLIICIMIYTTIFGNYMTYQYRGKILLDTNDYKEYVKVDKKFSKYNNSRSNSSDSCISNLGYTKRLNNIYSFNSNISGSAFKFYKSINYDRLVSTYFSINDKDINKFLGVKYFISCDNAKIPGYKYLDKINNYSIYENEDALDLGFVPDKYMLDMEFDKLSVLDKRKVLNNTVILDSDSLLKYKKLFSNDVIISSNRFKFLNNGFSSHIESSSDALLVYQIPYDKGFKAYNNSSLIDYFEVDNGLIGIKINKGVNNIVFNYYPPGLGIGIILSIVSLLLSIVYVFKNRS